MLSAVTIRLLARGLIEYNTLLLAHWCVLSSCCCRRMMNIADFVLVLIMLVNTIATIFICIKWCCFVLDIGMFVKSILKMYQ